MDMSVWYLVGAILVFFMQCGFAAVEAGFTRAKNAGNIIMKNLMDFCIGTVVFMALGYGIMNSGNYFFGLIGRPEYQMFTDFYAFDWSNFFFQLVFCATAATIVSGAMAERTKFSSYCIYSAVISAVVYPIEAGWVWNAQGWLARMGFIDFAGSAVIHMVGGISGLIGAVLLGARIGKYDGKGRSRPSWATTSPWPPWAPSSCGSAGMASTALRRRIPPSWPRSWAAPPLPLPWPRWPVCCSPGLKTASRTWACA